MFKKIAHWFRRFTSTPPLLERQENGTASRPVPPPPPQGRSGPPPPAPKEMQRKHRRLHVVQGGRTEKAGLLGATEGGTEPAGEDSPTKAKDTSVKLVFSDGSSQAVGDSTPGGVRIRYLAQNLLDPDDGPAD